jgi:membrane protease YdiL (CAAX protease family)
VKSARGDILKILAFFFGVLVLGALLTPWLYRAAHAYVEVVGEHPDSALSKYLAGAIHRSPYSRYFVRSVQFSAAVLLFPMIYWLGLRRGAGRRFRDTLRSLRFADAQVDLRGGQPLRRNPHGWRDLGLGFLLGTSVLAVLGWVLTADGWFHLRANADLGRALSRAVPRTLTIPIAEEVIFRGLLLGIFLRAMRPAAAIAALGGFFAFVHFLKPPAGVEIAQPGNPMAGLEWLGHIVARFGDPMSMAGQFGTLLMVGVVLSYARWRTASLWLPVGLHAGWVFALAVFKGLAAPVKSIDASARYLVGFTLRDGIVPMLAVLATGLLIHVLTSSSAARQSPHDENG